MLQKPSALSLGLFGFEESRAIDSKDEKRDNVIASLSKIRHYILIYHIMATKAN
jgi:hypothetical protein